LLYPPALGYPGPGPGDYYDDHGPGPHSDPVCENPENMPRHQDYERMFASLAEYGRESVDDLVIKWSCRLLHIQECSGYGRNYGPGGPYTLVEVDANKTVLQRFEPIVKDLEKEIERYTGRDEECPYWTSLAGTTIFHSFHTGEYYFKVTRLRNIILGHRGTSRISDKIGRSFRSVLKSLNTNDDADKRLIREAVDTVFGSSSVSVFELLELHLRTQTKETKGLLKMVAANYISKYLTPDRVTCYLQELTKNKILDDHLFSAGKDIFNIQNIAVEKIIKTTRDVLKEQGTFPYIDLAHAVIDQLDDVNIPDIMNTQYRNFVKIQRWSNSIDWDKEFEKLVEAVQPTFDQVMKALLCTKEGKLGISEIIKQIIKNVYAENLDETLDQNIRVLFNFLPPTLRKMQEESGYVLNESKSTQWIRPFHITDLMKQNPGALSTILNYELDVKYDGYNEIEYAVGSAVRRIIAVSDDVLFFTFPPIVPNIRKHLFKGISLSAEEEKTVVEPLLDFGTRKLPCLYSDFMQKAFYSIRYPTPSHCH